MRIIFLYITLGFFVLNDLKTQDLTEDFSFVGAISHASGGWGVDNKNIFENNHFISSPQPPPKREKFGAPFKSSAKIKSFGENCLKPINSGVNKGNNLSFIEKGSIVKLTLDQIIELAKSQSIAARQASTQKETAYWQYRSYLSNYKPQLTLNGTLPNFNRTFQEVLQPDGTIEFRPVTNNNSSLTFSLNQQIAATGATIFVNSQLQRFDDFDRDFTLYNGLPIGIGIEQPLFAFNPLKWDKKTEPLRYEESKQNYIESLENIGLSATNRFFEFLISQVNLQIAESNVSKIGRAHV